MLTLGLELISSETVALAELVKNAYDADGRFVLIRLTGPLTEGAGVIEVLDDGSGISPEVVASAWLEPATPSRRRRRTSAAGRRSLGGRRTRSICRSKLAEQITLYTRPAEDIETDLSINWSDFADEDKYLDQVDIPSDSHRAEIFKRGGTAHQMWRSACGTFASDLPESERPDGRHGTLLRMSGLRSAWTPEDCGRRFERALSRLVSPSASLAGAGSDFTIFLDLPLPLAGIGGLERVA